MRRPKTIQRFDPEKYGMIFCPNCRGAGRFLTDVKGVDVCKVCGGFGLIKKEEKNVRNNWVIAQFPK